MNRIFEISIISIALTSILGTLFLCLEILTPGDLQASVTDASASLEATFTEPITTTTTETTDTSILLAESVPDKNPDVSTSSKRAPIASGDGAKTASVSSPNPSSVPELLHSLTNTAREQSNLYDLAFDAKLSKLALERSEEMLRLHYFSHTSPNGCDLKCRFTNSSYQALSWGENLAESTSHQMMDQAELAQMFMQMWLQSAGHRDNLLSNQFTHQGIGTAESNGRMVVTVIFASN